MTSETTPPAPTAPTCQCCRFTLIIVLVSLLMMCLGNGLLLWNQIRAKTNDIAIIKRAIAEFQANNEPRINEFVASLQAYGRSNPDFVPILAKYGVLPPTSAPAAPAAPAAPKK